MKLLTPQNLRDGLTVRSLKTCGCGCGMTKGNIYHIYDASKLKGTFKVKEVKSRYSCSYDPDYIFKFEILSQQYEFEF